MDKNITKRRKNGEKKRQYIVKFEFNAKIWN